MNVLMGAKLRRLLRAFPVLAVTFLLLTACGETTSIPDEGSGNNEPSVVFEMTLPTTTQEPREPRTVPNPETGVEKPSPEPDTEEDGQRATRTHRAAL